MTRMILPRGVSRRQVRYICPHCASALPLVAIEIETTIGKRESFSPPDTCPSCGEDLKEWSAYAKFCIAEQTELFNLG